MAFGAQKNLSIRLAVVDGKKVENTFERIGNTGEKSMHRIRQSTKPASQGLKNVDTAARALNGVLRQAAGLVAVYAGLSGISNGLRSVTETGMAFEGLGTALTTVAGNSQAAAQEMAFIEAESERLGLSLLTTAQSYLGIAAAAKGTALQGQATRDIFVAVAEASAVLQLSADQTSGALRAIGQIMSKGKVQAEELRGQLGERLYGAFQIAARGMGISTAELDKMLEQGKLVAEDFLPKFAAEIRKTFSEGVPEASRTARAEMNRLNNSILAIERDIAAGGFLQGLTEGMQGLTETLRDPEVRQAAEDLGYILGETVTAAANALGLLIENADLAVTALSGLIVARTVAGAVAALSAAIMGNAGLVVGLTLANNISTAFAARLVVMEGAITLAKVAMLGLRSAMLLVGGPVGIAVLAGIAIWKLAQGHDAAAKAAKDHANELREVRAELEGTADSAEKATDSLTQNEAIFRLNKQLMTARENIRELNKELLFDPVGGFFDRAFRSDALEEKLETVRREFRRGEISAKEYNDAVFKLAEQFPEFEDEAEGIKQQVLALLAAEKAAQKASKALQDLRNPPEPEPQAAPAADIGSEPLSKEESERIQKRIAELAAEEQALRRLTTARQQGEAALQQAMVVNEQEQTLRRLGLDLLGNEEERQGFANQIKNLVENLHTLRQAEKDLQEQERLNQEQERERQKTVEDVRKRFMALDQTLEAATARAEAWRREALLGLDETATGYEEFRAQVDAVFNQMLKEAREDDLRSSREWQDGVIRGLRDVADEAGNVASQTERLFKNAFQGMEDALVEFVKTGKLDFKSLADAIITDLIRMQIQASITAPLSGALNAFVGSFFGSAGSATTGTSAQAISPAPTSVMVAHSGGVLGGDSFAARAVSPSVFDGASRFHTGGVVGSEMPIIAQRGETVFTPGQMAALGGALQSKPEVNVSVNVQNRTSTAAARAEVSRDGNGDMSLNIIIEQVEGTLARNIGRGEGLAPTLERRYGLNPAAGSFR